MKRIYKISIVFALSIAFASCTDLEENPVGLLAPESFFKTKADAESAIMGAYGLMTTRHDYGIEFFYLTEVSADMVISASGTGDLNALSDFTEATTHVYVSNVWRYLYKNISACNNVINGVDDIDESDEVKNQLKAEAMAIKAHTYFRLIRLYGDVPFVDEFVTDPEAVSSMARTPVAEIYPEIIAGLEFATQHLPDKNDKGIRSRVTKGTAYTILAEVYLTLEEWEKAAEYATYVIEHKDDFGYGLSRSFAYLFDADIPDQDEFIWVADFLSDYGSYPYNFDMFSNVCGVEGSDISGWSTLVTTEAAMNSFDERDYRRDITFCSEIEFNGVLKPYTEFSIPLPHIYKYFIGRGVDGVGGYTTDANVIIYRYAEVLLMAAEALNEVNGGPTAEAYDYINEVRERARYRSRSDISDYPNDLAGLNQDEFRAAVIEERRVELAHEHKRWFDIKRHNLFEEVFTGPNSTEPHDKWNVLFPIPQREIDNNSNLSQNPGY